MKKRAFTIVELLMVIAVIAVLMGIVTTAASSSIRSSRSRKASALCKVIQVGLATYYAQKGEWPISILNNPTERANVEGDNYQTDPNVIVLTCNETHEAIRALVEQTKKGNPLIDVSGLFVSTYDGRMGQKCYGLDFMQAATIKGMSQAKSRLRDLSNGKRITVNQMKFGYPESSHGYFRRFKIVYSIPGDDVTVSTQDSDHYKAQYYKDK